MVESNTRELSQVMDQVRDLAVLPHVVFKVLELTTGDGCSVAELEKAISIDPGFSSKVLVLVNSAAYGLPRKLGSIREAISFLGIKAIRSIAMTVGVYDLFVGKTDRQSMRRRTWWRMSIDAAVGAQWIAKQRGYEVADEAYTCGLLHLVGRTLLDRSSDGKYEFVTDLIAKENLNIVDAERIIFGVNHIEVAIHATKTWNLPAAIIRGVDYYPLASEEPITQLQALTSLGAFTSQIATEGFDLEINYQDRAPKWALELLGLELTDTEKIILGANTAMAEAGRRN